MCGLRSPGIVSQWGMIGRLKIETVLLATLASLVCLSFTSCSETEASGDVAGKKKAEQKSGKKPEVAKDNNLITLGGGCFWCTEAVFEQFDGVLDVQSGYMGGHVENPTYEQICTKTTGHAEVIQVKFDPQVISVEKLLDIFWKAHDPTTPNQQGADIGPQYRSVIFYHNEEQKLLAEKSMAALDASEMYSKPAVTEISPVVKFWKAEVSHQDYYRLNKSKNPYCRVVITPKMKKFGFE